jgi:hypothetical protein
LVTVQAIPRPISPQRGQSTVAGTRNCAQALRSDRQTRFLTDPVNTGADALQAALNLNLSILLNAEVSPEEVSIGLLLGRLRSINTEHLRRARHFRRVLTVRFKQSLT